MKTLITGSSGMLGRALCRQLANQYEVTGLDIIKAEGAEQRVDKFIECDITDREQTKKAVVSARPDIVIHAAAYTDVDGCEKNPQKANEVNALGTENVALACKSSPCLLIYISTDFVFDGEKSSAYTEKDAPRPINVYGKSKHDGEKFVQSILKDFVIIRSSWLFGKGGKNFVDTLRNKAKEQKTIKVVEEQVGSPTYAKDLAGAIDKLISKKAKINGIFHITNSGSCSWYEFAQVVKELAGLNTEIELVSEKQYPSPTKRPRMSILNNKRYQEFTGDKLRHWQPALQEYLQNAFLVD